MEQQIGWLLGLAVPVACVAWTVTHEEVFREVQEYCREQATNRSRPWWWRKFFYLPTCEYCFSHCVCLLFLALSGFRLLLPDWRGWVMAFFGVVWVANIYLGLFVFLRVSINQARAGVKANEAAARRRV